MYIHILMETGFEVPVMTNMIRKNLKSIKFEKLMKQARARINKAFEEVLDVDDIQVELLDLGTDVISQIQTELISKGYKVFIKTGAAPQYLTQPHTDLLQPFWISLGK